VPWTPPDQIPAIVARARAAQTGWAALPLKQRCSKMLELARRVVEHREEAAALLEQEIGRHEGDNLLSEVSTLISYAKGAVAVAKKALKPERIRLSAIEFPGKKVVVEAVPRGVVAIIAPWNYPLLQFYKPLFPALLSGNAVVLKPSEHTPRTGRWLAEQCAAVLPEGLVGLVIGDGEAGAALLESEVNAVVFTGSTAVGRRIAAQCGERLIPCSVELGGKDAAIVLADCNLDRTVAGIAFAALHNAGQDCSGVEVVYVEEAIADTFVERLAGVLRQLRVAPNPDGADLCPLQNAEQLDIVADHVQDAVARGARVVVGGAATGTGFGFQPTLLEGCTPEMKVVTKETFGPVIAVIRVKDAQAAVPLVNASHYGLSGSVWTKDLDRGAALARRLEVGMAYVNNHSFAGVIPKIPWTGTKESGTGIAASTYSYATYVRRRTVIVDSNSNPEPFWMPADANLTALGHTLAEFNLGAVGKVFKLLGLLGKRVAAVKGLVAGEK